MIKICCVQTWNVFLPRLWSTLVSCSLCITNRCSSVQTNLSDFSSKLQIWMNSNRGDESVITADTNTLLVHHSCAWIQNTSHVSEQSDSLQSYGLQVWSCTVLFPIFVEIINSLESRFSFSKIQNGVTNPKNGFLIAFF